MAYDLFISYAHDDAVPVQQLAEQLVSHGLRPWLDRWDLVPGTPWHAHAVEALRQCPACVVVCGRKPINGWQLREVSVAVEEQTVTRPGSFRVIPLLLPGCSRPEQGL